MNNRIFVDDKDHDQQIHPDQKVAFSESTILSAFEDVKWRTDDFVKDEQLEGYVDKVDPRLTELCIVYILDAFEQLGYSIRSAEPGQRLRRVFCHSKHERQLNLLYRLLEHEARLIDITDTVMTRTAVSPPLKSADVLLAELLRDEPVHASSSQLTALLGRNLADCLSGKVEGAQLLFAEGRELLTHLYSKSPFMEVWVNALESFFGKLVESNLPDGEPLCILEIGAGTSSATNRLLPMLAGLGRPVKYTMSDPSEPLVDAARKKFKHFDFMEFRALDVESEPDPELLCSQHIIISTNRIHATKNLSISLANIHRMLRADGVLLLLELTKRVAWIDFIFGLVDGWWLFDDDRSYALASETHWESVLYSVGYGHVDWTEGNTAETHIQRLIIAHKTAARRNRAPKPPSPLQAVPTPSSLSTDAPQRQATIEAYVGKFSENITVPLRSVKPINDHTIPSGRCVLVTGATGNLGAHLVAYLASLEDLRKVVCLNRLSNTEATLRQHQSFKTKGIELDPTLLSKLEVIATDTSEPMLGLSPEVYDYLARNVTHIIHSAWPTNLTQPLHGYENQFKILRHLICLACDASAYRPANSRFGFQFVSSIATLANYRFSTGKEGVPAELAQIEATPPCGDLEAKVVCERILSQTIHRHSHRFHAAITRIAQISGSTTCGYWPSTEYVPLMVKSSQVLRVLPDLNGNSNWCPVNEVAAKLGELLLSRGGSGLVYHIDNHSRQPWKFIIHILARELGIPPQGIIPYKQWVNRVRRFRGSINDNPALQLIEFWDKYFIPMSCGVLKLTGTSRMQAINDDLLVKYMTSWKRSGFLHEY